MSSITIIYGGIIILIVIFFIMAASLFNKKIRINPFISNTYIFWSLLLFFISGNLFLLIVVPLSPLMVWYYKGLMPFFIIPMLVALLSALIFWLLYEKFIRIQVIINRRLFPIIFNFVLLCAFLISGDSYKNKLIEKKLAGHKPDCIEMISFTDSLVQFLREDYFRNHSFFTEGDKKYFWSYSQKDFFSPQYNIAKNYSCRNNRKLLSDGSLGVN